MKLVPLDILARFSVIQRMYQGIVDSLKCKLVAFESATVMSTYNRVFGWPRVS